MFITLRTAEYLEPHWSDWFEGLSLRQLADGSTELSGDVADQSALYGLLSRARDLGLTLLSVSMESADSEQE